MANKITCGKCGEENSQESKYCFNCGQKLNKSVTTKKKPSTTINTDYPDIKKGLQRLIKVKGFLAISIGEYYVQFFNKPKESILVFEAVSGNFHHLVQDKDKDFEEIGFLLKPKENYIKHIPLVIFSVNETIRDIKTIFEDIYQVEFSSYKIESDFDYSKPMKTAPNKDLEVALSKKTNTIVPNITAPKKRNNTFKIILIAFLLIMVYSVFSDGGGSDYDKRKRQLETHFHFNGSNIELTKWIKRNMNDPKSYEHVKTVYSDREDYIVVQTDYRGKNAFGAVVKGTVKAKIDNNGNIIEILDNY